MKKLIMGNWKMNGTRDDARALISEIVNGLDGHDDVLEKCKLVVCPPFLHISDVRHALYGFPSIRLGAQDASAYDNGAQTGDISAEMLQDAGCQYVILGHSERRQYQQESNALIAQKAALVLKYDMSPVICVGETQEERDSGKAKDIVAEQLKSSMPDVGTFEKITIAYEPVWAIGTGKTATPEDAGEMHAFIREQLKSLTPDASKIRILYGGSMKPENAADLLSNADIDGGLIGGASLKANDFIAIARAA